MEKFTIIPYCKTSGKHKVMLDGVCPYCNEVVDQQLQQGWVEIRNLQARMEKRLAYLSQ